MKIHVSIQQQLLTLTDEQGKCQEYRISTAANGVGEQNGSECTPRGLHQVSEKFGENAPINSVFVGRRETGEIYSPALRTQFPQRDWILTRILWLEGCEPGRNQGGECDTKARYIYLHGSPDDVEMGTPGSHGCIRMRNIEIIELYAKVPVGTTVLIEE